MKKAIVVVVFALALCWGVSHFANLNVITFTVAGVGITRTMLCAAFGVGLCAWLMGRR